MVKIFGMDLKQLGLVLVLTCAIVFGAGYKTAQFNEKRKAEAIVAAKTEKVSEQEKRGNITVYVTGAVKKPGVYTLPDGSRIVEAVNKAEPLKEADLNSINLAGLMKDEMPIYVASKGELDFSGAGDVAAGAGDNSSGTGSITGKGGTVERSGTGSKTGTAGKTGAGSNTGTGGNIGSSSVMRLGVSGGSFGTGPGKGKININTAGSKELDQLKGIGPALAERIIDYRNENGKFNNVSELKKVSGIGSKKFAEIQEQITVQ